MKDLKKWDRRFLELAKLVGSWSKDPSTQVGAVIVDQQQRIVSVGYNGFPLNVEDTLERLENREVKLKLIVHAEANAILFAKTDLSGCTLYTYPIMPCTQCAGMAIQSSISRCVAPDSCIPRWKEIFDCSTLMLQESGVQLDLVPPGFI